MEIKTKRLILRKIKLTDINDLINNINNINVSKWLLVVPYPYKRKDALYWIKKQNKNSKKKFKEEYFFGIILKDTNKLIGGIGIHGIDNFQKKAEIGYWLGEPYWNKGYGSEVLKEIINFLFNKLKLRRLEANVFEGNLSSGKLLEKFGFILEGKKIKASVCKADGKIKNDLVYGLLKEDYKKI